MKMTSNSKIVKASNQSKPDAKYWELQNKLKFIKVGSQEAEITLKADKILIIYIIKRSWADLKSIFEKLFISEFWNNFLVMLRYDYLKEIRKLLIVM